MKGSLTAAILALSLCAGCATPVEHSADVDSYAPKIYRTGSNLPVKDYGAQNIEVGKPYTANPANLPVTCTNKIFGC